MSLLDVQIAAISHINMNYLVSGKVPPRMGTAHPSIVPYQVFDGADGKFVLAVGNDGQFAKLCEIIGQPSLAQRPSFRTNVDRVSHRDKLILLLTAEFAKQPVAYWTERLIAAGVPCGPINDLRQVFADEHVRFREMQREIPHQRAGVLPILANPIRFSETPPSYDRAPPALGEHTTSVLAEELGLSTVEIDSLARAGVI
jgi:crotonobetainyl-CoA:carnitine CoA-transferase CaiB-like acyl-CoA transferase